MAAQKNYICVKEEEVAELLGQDGIRMRNGHKHFYKMVDTKNTIDVEPVEVDPTKVAPVQCVEKEDPDCEGGDSEEEEKPKPRPP